MLHIKSLDEGLELFKALGSDIRVEIIKILLNENAMNMNELASRLNILLCSSGQDFNRASG